MSAAFKQPVKVCALAPALVPASCCVYAIFTLLLCGEQYSSACALLGVAIYGACLFSCLTSTRADDGRAQSGGVADRLTALASSRAGVFALINLVSLGCYVYAMFIGHVLRRRYGGGGADDGADVALAPPLGRDAETLFGSRVGLLVLVNAGYVLLFSSFAALRALVFDGRLRDAERASLTDAAAAYIASKVVLLAALDPDTLELVMWVSWFSLLGFLRLFARLIRLRLADCTLHPTTASAAPAGGPPRLRPRRLAALAHVLLGSALFWLGVAMLLGATARVGVHALALLTAECAMLAVDSLSCVAHGRAAHARDWEARREARHALELAHDATSGVLTMAQHAHTWLIHGPAGTLLDAFLLAAVYAEAAALARRGREHAAFVERGADLRRCPVASATELRAFNDTCVVCLDPLVPAEAVDAGCCARRLKCGHIFHSVCLSAWLEGNRSCPTCRAPTSAARPDTAYALGGQPPSPPDEQPDIRLRRPPSDPGRFRGLGGGGRGDDPVAAAAEAAELNASVAHCIARLRAPRHAISAPARREAAPVDGLVHMR
jgi:hypothetical protein